MLDLFRILVVVMLAMHGIAHITWFLAAWTPIHVGVRDGPWMLPGKVTIRSPIGRVLGLLALVVVITFVAAAASLLFGQPAWRSIANAGVFLSLGAVLPWLRQSPGSLAINAVVADLVLMFLLALPLSVELTGGAS